MDNSLIALGTRSELGDFALQMKRREWVGSARCADRCRVQRHNRMIPTMYRARAHPIPAPNGPVVSSAMTPPPGSGAQLRPASRFRDFQVAPDSLWSNTQTT